VIDFLELGKDYQHFTDGREFKRHQQGMLCQLKTNKGQDFIVAHTHLQWNPALDFVKMAQALYLLEKLWDFTEKKQPIIICGDLNS
jgi:endonuclease/exonuclease/phosphatase family metal-dependent hydrolase